MGKQSSAVRRWNALPYLLIAPAIACELLVHVVPILLAVLLSFLRLNQFTIGDWTSAPVTGLNNYRVGLDPTGAIGSQFWSTLGRTAAFTGIVVALSWGAGLFAAVLLDAPFRGREFFRAWFLIPFALPAYVTGIGWRFIFARDDGALNRLLVDDLHLTGHRPFWLLGGNAFWATVIVSVWRLWPFACLVLSAALRSVPKQLYEAAAVDGASGWGQFRAISLPSIGRINALVVLVMALWSFNEFTVPYVLFAGSPPQSATLVSNLVYRDAFGTFEVGISAAMNLVVVALLLVVGSGYVRAFLRPEVTA